MGHIKRIYKDAAPPSTLDSSESPKDLDRLLDFQMNAVRYLHNAVTMVAEVHDGPYTQLAGYIVLAWVNGVPWYKRHWKRDPYARTRPRDAHLLKWTPKNDLKSRYEFIRSKVHTKMLLPQTYKRERALLDAKPEYLGLFEIWKYSQYWCLYDMAVAPEFQGRGVGQCLLRWSIDRAHRDDTLLMMTAEPGTDGFFADAGLERFAVFDVEDEWWFVMVNLSPKEDDETEEDDTNPDPAQNTSSDALDDDNTSAQDTAAAAADDDDND